MNYVPFFSFVAMIPVDNSAIVTSVWLVKILQVIHMLL